MAMMKEERRRTSSSSSSSKNNDGNNETTASNNKEKDVTVKSKPKPKLSKRQEQKQLAKSDKNRWLIQHPKVQSMETRERIQIKDAGLKPTKSEVLSIGSSGKKTTTSSNNNHRTAILDPQLDMINSPEIKFGKLLGSTDQRQRHLAVRKLKLWLTARCDPDNVGGGISHLDLLKLWKALWYTLYMADKQAVQDELSHQLAKLIWCVAGTPEEDDYAAQSYILLDSDEEIDSDEEVDSDEEMDSDEEDEDGDPEVTLEVIENNLGSDGSDDDEDGDSGDDEDNEEGEEQDAMNDIDDDTPSELVPHCRGVHLVTLFIRSFFRTIRRDWHTMDKYRIDKFYTLIRYMIHEMYSYLNERQWHYGMIRMFNDVLFEEVLRETPNGLRYHLIDIVVDELVKVVGSTTIGDDDDDDNTSALFTTDRFVDVMEPFLAMSQTGANDPIVQQRVMDRILDKFLEEHSVVSDNCLAQLKEQNDDDDGDDGKSSSSDSIPIFQHVSVATMSQIIFGLGSDIETADRYRKSLYDMHKKYERRLKQVGDGIDVIDQTEEEEEDDDDESPMDEILPTANDDDEPMDQDEDDDTFDKNDDVAMTDIDPPQEETKEDQEEKEDSATKKKKKKKSKKKRKSGERDGIEEEEITPVNKASSQTSTPEEVSDDIGPKSKKKRKKNDDVKATKTASSPSEKEEEKEEVVMISLLEQQYAKKREAERASASADSATGDRKKDKKKKKNKGNSDVPNAEVGGEGSTPSRRVKWDKANKAKSHKASMKALKTTTPPSTKDRTPEKGILRPSKHKKTPDSSTSINKKNRRKRASDYW